MDWTAPQRRLINEGEFDSHELIEYKIQRAMEMAREMEGWDVFSTPREQNINLMGEDYRTVAARFLERDVADRWAHLADGDHAKIHEWHDERFHWDCYLVVVTWLSPGYEPPEE